MGSFSFCLALFRSPFRYTENNSFSGATSSESREPGTHTFAAAVVSRVQNLVIRAAALPSSGRGEAQAAAAAIVDATRVGACGQTDGRTDGQRRRTGSWSGLTAHGPNKQVCVCF